MLMQGLWPAQQYRMRRLQVFNWGTFSGLHDIPITEEGFLFVGRSGSGKSTVLDALSALLAPPQWLVFNAAAREGEKGRHDRHWVSYIRGAWADQTDNDSGEIASQYLRTGTTWSALAVEYANLAGQSASLVQILWLRGSASRAADVRHHFMVSERSFNIATELKEFDLDLRNLKHKLSDVRHFETFSAYGEHFRRLLGIESEMALKLLHKTQSAKNLGDLNSFLRDYMLDRPPTFEVTERMVKEFAELDAAHQAVVTARRQVNTLRPARDDHRKFLSNSEQLVRLEELRAGVDAYRDRCKVKLLDEEIERLRTQDQGLEGEERRQQEMLDNNKTQLALLEAEHREQGGVRIQELERDRKSAEQQRDDRMAKRGQAETACKTLGRSLPDTPQGFAELAAEARGILEGRREANRRADEQRDALNVRQREAEKSFSETRREVEAMQRQPSNIPAHMLDLRRQLTTALGLPESDLPFAGELIEVRKEAAEWQGAVERVLRGFALSLLVEERHYAGVSSYVNETRLNQRLVYHRVAADTITSTTQPVQSWSLVNKLLFKDNAYRPWLDAEFRRRFDYACVDNMRDFRQTERAVTREGQVRHGRSRHEKDDRRPIDDPHGWVLGFDNREKRRLYQERAQQLADEIGRVRRELEQLEADREKREERLMACQTLTNLQWQEIDVASMLDRIHALDKMLAEFSDGNRVLKELGERIMQQRTKLKEAEDALNAMRAERIVVKKQIDQYGHELDELRLQLQSAVLTDYQQQALKARFEAIDKPVTLKNLESQRTAVERGIGKEIEGLQTEQGSLKQVIEKCFSRFLGEWREHAGDLDETLASAPDFMVLLERLEHDGLPKHEQRFFDMLKEQSTENLAALNTHLAKARKEIRERMDLVNESLSQAEFGHGTHLEIVVNDRYLPEVRVFREQVKQVLDNAWLTDAEGAEARFGILRELVNRLGSAESEHQRWRELVLDVRQHVEFMGREYDKAGQEVEIYRTGAGKSGGQREKLATTCLAAALRYQLGGSDSGLPLYAPVVLDEAFGKADNEFTELAMKIFTNFGFQMIVATPLKSVMTLEPFIGGACFVDISDRKRSATLQIEYDRQRRRLNLPERMRGEVVSN
ncbi:MAG: ATP-binding protein [Gammaproteobacteria bacterium]|nr:MAG: ATP-binding protein [Gammaproteobacteria bacterium]